MCKWKRRTWLRHIAISLAVLMVFYQALAQAREERFLPYAHPRFTVNLPAGWKVSELPDFPEELWSLISEDAIAPVFLGLAKSMRPVPPVLEVRGPRGEVICVAAVDVPEGLRPLVPPGDLGEVKTKPGALKGKTGEAFGFSSPGVVGGLGLLAPPEAFAGASKVYEAMKVSFRLK